MKAALYCRLSEEDRNKPAGTCDSGSIQNQKTMLLHYAMEQGQVYARACMLNVLAALEKAVGDLRRVKSAVKITTFVQSADDFHEQPAVANGGTQLLLELWGVEAGLPSRSAIGVNALPGNIPVETEALFEVDTVSP